MTGPEPIRPVAELFVRSASALWATTYNVDLRLFSEFLLPRLGAVPLNATVLADDRRLAHSLSRTPPDRLEGLATVNRRWLLRGVRARGPAFHPKSYLSVAGRSATLLVGSGNLSVDGLDEGREVFTAFRAGTAEGDRAIAVWQSWMRRLVRRLDDPILTARFADLEERLPAPERDAPDTVASQLLHNLDVPLADQFVGAVARADGVDELLLAAPFYDADADAVGRLITALRPRRVTVYVTSSTSVDGAVLRRRLAGLDLRVLSYDPDRFTHAKLMGVVAGDQGWLLSGSANLSRAALLQAESRGGNVELGVVTRLTAAEVRGRFLPTKTSVVIRDPDHLDALGLAIDEDMPTLPVRLVRVDILRDGRLAPHSEPPAEEQWLLADREVRHPLAAGAHGAIATRSPVEGRLVHLVDADGLTLSNPVLTDDAAALAAALGEGGDGPDRHVPSGLNDADLNTPLGRALQTLHRELVMDVTENADPSPQPTGSGDAEADTTDDEFWDRVERERLAADPRGARYGQAGNRGGSLDLVLQVLEALGARVPQLDGTSPLDVEFRPPAQAASADEATGRRWSARARIRIRVRNVLRKWAAAQSDPSLRWIDRFAPVTNLSVITGVLGPLRMAAAAGVDVVLTEADIDEIWWLWLASFVGTGRQDGFLDRLDSGETAEAVGRLSPWFGETAALLCWIAVRRGPEQRKRIVNVQAVLIAALEQDLLNPTSTTARWATRRGRGTKATTVASVTDDLLNAGAFVDDDLWCDKAAAELHLTGLRLEHVRDRHSVPLRLLVTGIDDPLTDVRMPRLLDAVLRYRRGVGVAICATSETMGAGPHRITLADDWRVVFVANEPLAYLPGRSHDLVDSLDIVDEAQLKRLSAAGLALEAVFAAAVHEELALEL